MKTTVSMRSRWSLGAGGAPRYVGSNESKAEILDDHRASIKKHAHDDITSGYTSSKCPEVACRRPEAAFNIIIPGIECASNEVFGTPPVETETPNVTTYFHPNNV